eukprot:PITA_27792
MSKLINLFSDSDKLEGTKSYKTWHRLIESTLIYNELWQGICDGDVKPNKPTDATALAKWEINNAKALALIKSSVNDEMYVHIENAIDAWTALKTFKDLFDTQPESKKVDLQLKLLQQKLTEGGDVLEYISRLKNIRKEIITVGFPAIDDSFMVTIVIAGLPSSYTHFLETLQRPALVSHQQIVLEEEADGIRIKQHIIEVEAKAEETILTEEEIIFKVEETTKEEAIFKDNDIIIKVEDNLKIEVKAEAEDNLQEEEET